MSVSIVRTDCLLTHTKTLFAQWKDWHIDGLCRIENSSSVKYLGLHGTYMNEGMNRAYDEGEPRLFAWLLPLRVWWTCKHGARSSLLPQGVGTVSLSGRVLLFRDGRRRGQQREGAAEEREDCEEGVSQGYPEMETVSNGLLRLASVVVRAANQACTLHLGKMQVGQP